MGYVICLTVLKVAVLAPNYAGYTQTIAYSLLSAGLCAVFLEMAPI